MAGKLVDLVNKRFNKLLVVAFCKIQKNTSIWKCLCDCGSIVYRSNSSLRRMMGKRKDIKGCGCSKGLAPGEAIFNELVGDYKYGAKIKGRAFKLSIKKIKELIYDKCVYCDRFPYRYYKNGRTGRKGKLLCNGIDRINNNIGYYKNNVQTSCKECNILRRDSFTVQETRIMAQALKRFRKRILC